MVARIELNLDMLTGALSFEPDTGLLRWKKNGRVAGHYGPNHYVQIRFSRKLCALAHRVAWLIYYGSLPEAGMVIDHINRNKHDNRISNLRAVSHSENHRNSARTDAGGACLCKQTGKWKAYYVINRKQIWLGRHDTRSAALQAALSNRPKLKESRL